MLAPITHAQETQIPSGAYRIAGTVVNAKAGNALTRCRVTITDGKNRNSIQSRITGEDGRFEFRVPAGTYALEGAKRGFVTSAYNQHEQFSSAIVAGVELDTENLVLRLAPNAALTGRVIDEVGDPVRNAQIMVYRQENSSGLSRVSFFRGTATDDQGRYEVTPLDEGAYFVSAKASPWYAVHPSNASSQSGGDLPQVDSSLDVAYPITYYGDATEANDATLIPIRAGERVDADIHLNPVPSVHLILHVPEASGPPRLSKTTFDGAEQFEGANIQNISPGVVELTGVASGRYSVRMPDSNGQMKESTEVDLGNGGELDLSSGKPTSQIKATVQIAGMTSLPAQLTIILSDSRGRRIPAQVDARGEADFSDVIPGKYEIAAAAAGETYSVTRIGSQAGIISGHSVTVPGGASLTIALSLVGGSATINGFAKREGKPVSGAMIVLVPENPETDRDRFRRDESNLDGSFTLTHVIPGSYSLVAIDNGWDLDWAKPGVMAQYFKKGQAIEVGDHSHSPMQLTATVEVQVR
jgi:hypothetical protein